MESEIPLAKNYYGGRRMSFESNQPSVYIPLSNIFIDKTRSYYLFDHSKYAVSDIIYIKDFENEVTITHRNHVGWTGELN